MGAKRSSGASSYDWILDVIPQAVQDLLPPFLLNPDPEIYLSNNFVVADLETNTRGDGGSPLAIWPQNNVVCGSWCSGQGDAHNIYGNQLELQAMLDAMLAADFIVMYNGKFDLGYLKRAGIDLYKVVLWDPQIAEYCLAGNRKVKLTLDATYKRYFPTSAGKKHFVQLCMEGGVDPADIPQSMLVTRCNEDVLMTRDLFLVQREAVVKRGMLGHVYTRSLLSSPLCAIEAEGMHLDKEAVRTLYAERSTALATASAAMDEFTGGINPRSPKQVKEFVYEVLKFTPKYKGRGKNKTPIYSTKTDDLLALKATNKRQREFVRLKKLYAGLNADVSKNLLFFNSIITDPDDDSGVFYASFNQCITVTHRLSSSGIKRIFTHVLDDKGKPLEKSVQFQNFKREFKSIFMPRNEGWVMGEADGSQLEFRSAAFQSQCPVATQAIVNNLDVHSDTSRILGENGQETDRQNSKQHTFKPLRNIGA